MKIQKCGSFQELQIPFNRSLIIPTLKKILNNKLESFQCTLLNRKYTEKQVESLPVIPYPVTQHATGYAALLNFNNILDQLDQSFIPVSCDESAYAIAREISQFNPDNYLYFGNISHG